MSLENFVVKNFLTKCFLAISFLGGQNTVQVKLENGTSINGEFIGTYMGHVHLLKGENINSFNCEDIQSVTQSGYVNVFEYDCNKNTVTADILFPPQLNPMTGEWETIIPDVFNPETRSFLAEEGEALSKNNGWDALTTSKEQLEKSKNTFQPMVSTKVRPTMADAFYKDSKKDPPQSKTQTNKKVLSSPPSNINPQKKIKKKLTTYSYENGTIGFSEDEIRKFIKKEVRKELRETLPYEIKKHKEQRQNKLFQNILLGCGAWFLFMIMLS